ncbi:hypothetical protein TKK_0003702 [Trichogramma kaykai]|uniref:MYND-type domain-containing protein n=1 Tax=Trichogramma kaykai TaxID=54128 RepID=A0ABD2XMF3_9HYME
MRFCGRNYRSQKAIIQKGTTILTSSPFAYVLSSYHRYTHCDHCFNKDKKLLKCSGCQYVSYCDRLCQKESWKIHKAECPNLKRVLPKIVPDAARLLARIVIKLQQGGADEKDSYGNNMYRRFKDLMSHYSDVKKDPKRVDHFLTLCQVLEDYLEGVELPNPAELMGIYGRICVNSYNILDTDMNSIGVGIYLGPSVIDHSCKPNAVAVFEGTKLMIRAIEDISQLDWSLIHISYIDILNTTKTRREELEKTYYFTCDCEKCKEPEPYATAAMCTSCKSACDATKEHCEKCQKLFPLNFKKEFNEISEFTVSTLESMRNTAYLDLSKKCLEKQENVMHPLNIQHIRTVESAFDASVNLGYWDDAENYGNELIPGYLHYYGETHPITGTLFLLLGKIQLHLCKDESALETLKKADEILKITHGEKHIVVRENLKPLLFQAISEVSKGK